MLYTITFAPSIDYLIEDHNQTFNPKGLNRIQHYQLLAGGKGINASVILNRLKLANQAFYFGGGATCELFENLLVNEKLNLVNIHVDDHVRINVKYFNANQHFEINGPRPQLTQQQKNELLDKLSNLGMDDVVLIMGQCDPEFLITIIKQVCNQKAKFAIDIDDAVLWDVLVYQPWVIKPNLDELARLLQKPLANETEIIAAMHALKARGAQNIIVSCGPKGSYLLTANNELFKVNLKIPVQVISTVGAGDTLLAGFIGHLMQKQNYNQAILNATALSLGTVTRPWLALSSDIELYKNNIVVTKLN